MPRIVSISYHRYTSCLRARQLQHVSSIGRAQPRRAFSHSWPHLRTTTREVDIDEITPVASPPPPSNVNLSAAEPEQGAMSRRLQSATEDALLEGGRAGRKAVEEAGFSRELKAKLLDRLQNSEFKSTYAASITEVSLPSYAGHASRDMATAKPWTGQEATEDAVLRMLDDAHKPLKPTLRGRNAAPLVDLRLQPRTRQTSGQRLAAAREKTDNYYLSQDPSISEKEREELRATLKERFGPAVRSGAMPNSFRGLEGLANERIEDAIARGQFRDIPRGQGALDLTRHGNPFIDTTEYLLNNMIKRQDIVPPWIEKQQEVVSTAENFRMRIRVEWKRHAARTIGSKGGSLEEQIRRAELYAAAEKKLNPRKRDIAGTPMPLTVGGNPLMQSLVEELAAPTADSQFSGPDATAVASEPNEPLVTEIGVSPEGTLTKASVTPELDTQLSSAQPISARTPLTAPLRDDQWLKTEQSYLELVISNLNSLTRSYNLMAPELAKKPYFSLERELKAMYADVAPELADEIRYRASRPTKVGVGPAQGKGAGVLEGFTAGHKAKIYDEMKPQYGIKELLKDWFGRKK